MKEQRITVEIGHDGTITADAAGFSGEACLKDLEKLLTDIASTWDTVERKPDAGDARVATRGAVEIGGKKA